MEKYLPNQVLRKVKKKGRKSYEKFQRNSRNIFSKFYVKFIENLNCGKIG